MSGSSTGTRSAEEIRAAIEQQRAELDASLGRLRTELTELSDWRAPLQRNEQPIAIGAAVTGFVLAGGIGAIIGLLRR